MSVKPSVWTTEKLQRANQMRKARMPAAAIDAELGLKPGSTETKFARRSTEGQGAGRPPRAAAVLPAPSAPAAPPARIFPEGHHHFTQASNQFVTEELLDARDHRSACACRRDLTGHILNDPPPGFSALDERRRESADA